MLASDHAIESGPQRRGAFWLIAGIGHCGTKWLTHVLDRPDAGIDASHELKCELFPGGWLASLQHEALRGVDGAFEPYVNAIDRRLAHARVVVDSNSWDVLMIPQLAERQRVDGVIYLVRHGVPNVHSVYTHNQQLPRDHWVFTNYIWSFARELGWTRRDYEALDVFGCWCVRWAANAWNLRHLQQHLGQQRVVLGRLEQLVDDSAALLGLLQHVGGRAPWSRQQLQRIQAQDINRKVDGDRSPGGIWGRWTPHQRATFAKICSPTLSQLGYDLPSTTAAAARTPQAMET